MYSDEFEDLEEARRGPRRAYVSSVSQQDADKLLRDNERLKKSVEKEKFFNKLLDQELKEVKEEIANRNPDDYRQHTRRGVSKGAFYTLLLICLAMAGFIAYTLYNNKQYNLFNGSGFFTKPAAGSIEVPAAAENSSENAANTGFQASSAVDGSTPLGEGDVNNATEAGPNTSTTTTESVPNIIDGSATAPVTKQKQQVIPAKEVEYNEAEVEAVLAELPPEPRSLVNVNKPVINEPVADTRPVIGRYRVTSKANFYDEPDENTLRSAFIRQSSDKIVSALDDRNGFIYVEFKNDLGYITKGWLSKGDLTKAE